MLRKTIPSLLGVALLCGFLLWTTQALASVDPVPSPQNVILSPQGARVEGEVKLSVHQRDGQPVLLLTLPQDAQEISLDLAAPHAKALRAWNTEQVSLSQADGSIAKARAALLGECDLLRGQIQAIRAQITMLSTPPVENQAAPNPAFIEQRLHGIQQLIPPLAADLAQKERQLEVLQQRLATLPDTARRATLAVMDVPHLKPEEQVSVRYAYTLAQSGWSPVYTFDARPAENSVHMRLMADVWQHSGVDWNQARIVLSTRSGWQREPQPLRPWVAQKGVAQPVPVNADMTARRAMPMMAKAAAGGAVEGMAVQAPEAFEGAALSGWTLPQGHGLLEGRTRIPVLEEAWNTPLQRVARPSSTGAQVWLAAKHSLQGKSLPAGEGTYLLEGSTVGTGRFAPTNGEATLYFGADPLVSVQTEPDTRLTGEAGIIGKRQTWQWGWTYTLRNDRAEPVAVRLEEPAPQAGDKDIVVTSEDKPASTPGKEHSIFWNVDVPAKGTVQVRHGVTITAPQGMPVSPGR